MGEPRANGTASSLPAQPPTVPSVPVTPDASVPNEVTDRAALGRVFVRQKALYLALVSGETKLLTSLGRYVNVSPQTQVSADGRWVAFVRHAPKSELWLASTEDGSERKLLTERASEKPEHNLTDFDSPQFSPDGRTLFFLVNAWETSAAIHAFDIGTLTERYILDTNVMQVIPSGPHAGRLFVLRHRYKTFPGEGYHSYEWCGVIDADGKVVQTVSTSDMTLCPGYDPLDRKRVEKALQIPSAGPRMPEGVRHH